MTYNMVQSLVLQFFENQWNHRNPGVSILIFIVALFPITTCCNGQVISTPAYLEGPRFRSWLRDRLSWLCVCFFKISSDPPGKCWGSISNHVMIVSFNIPFISLLLNHSVIFCELLTLLNKLQIHNQWPHFIDHSGFMTIVNLLCERPISEVEVSWKCISYPWIGSQW